MILAYIHSHKHRFGVEPICTVLSAHHVLIAPGTYYKWLACPVRDAELEEAYLVNRLVDLYVHHKRVFGVRKLWHETRRAGWALGRDQVARLMRIAGIAGVRRGQHRTTTTTRDERAPRHPDLVKRAWGAPTRPDALWVADFTYVWTACGFVYVSFVTDVFSRRILGWKCSTDKKTHLVSGALGQALATRRRADATFSGEGLVHHSDAGSQYTALAFTEELREAGIAGSIGTVGDALDNALMESTIGLYKTELIDQRATGPNWSGRHEVERETAEWVRWFNTERIHSSLGYVTPIERESMYTHTLAQRAEAA